MARDRSGSEYSENMSDATTCSCTTGSADKCSLRSCAMFQEPFFLHPPGSRARDGIYINPMSAYIEEPAKPKDTESFYLHSPHDLVYTRITRLFNDTEKQRVVERKDETLTVKVDVHMNNGPIERPSNGNGYATRAEIAREATEHAYEQICVRPEEVGNVGSLGHKKLPDNASESSRSRKTDRRCSRSSSGSESSNMSSEVHCFSSSTSTPSLSRNSSNERLNKSSRMSELIHEKKESGSGSQVESEKEMKLPNTGLSFAKPPPPPPPPPPPDKDDFEERKEPAGSAEMKRDAACNENPLLTIAANKSEASCGEHQQPEVSASSPAADTEESKTNQVSHAGQTSQSSHLVNRHMVLPFIPPKFANADSNTLLKPSEYLKSICKASNKNTLSKARSVDNLDIQGRDVEQVEVNEEEEEEEEEEDGEEGEKNRSAAGPIPPPPLSPLQKSRRAQVLQSTPRRESDRPPKTPQPLATISIQDLTSIQLRRTSTKMNATKTFSAPPPRSISMTNVSEPFFVQKTDLIAELKRTKDIPGIKKLKVERAQVEKTQEQNLISEISKAFSPSNFVDQIPEKDSSGNVIPIWKRQMLARKAAERAKKELEEQIAKENEERRQKAIPAWKRQLLAKKDNEEKRLSQAQSGVTNANTAKLEVAAVSVKKEAPPASPSSPTSSPTSSPAPPTSPSSCLNQREEKNEEQHDETRNDPRDDKNDDIQIIPWRAQLRKTNSKLNILD